MPLNRFLKAPGPPGAAISSEELIARLSTNLAPASTPGAGRSLLTATLNGCLLTALLFGAIFGYGGWVPDPSRLIALAVKLTFTGSIASLALWVATPLSRPGAEAGRRWPWLAAPLIGLWALGLGQLFGASAPARLPLLLGSSAPDCLAWILLGSLPPLALLLKTLRDQAPTRPALAGATIGLAAGALGAAIYALHCGETGLPFIGVWYAAGIALSGGVGALAGSRLLRW